MFEQHIMKQYIASHCRFNECFAWARVTTDHEVAILFPEGKAHGWCHRAVIDFKGFDDQFAQFHLRAMADLVDLDIQAFNGWSLLMHHATLQFRSPDLQQSAEEFLAACWSDNLQATITALVPG